MGGIEDGKAAAGFKRAASVPASETLTAPPDIGAVARIFLHSRAAAPVDVPFIF